MEWDGGFSNMVSFVETSEVDFPVLATPPVVVVESPTLVDATGDAGAAILSEVATLPSLPVTTVSPGNIVPVDTSPFPSVIAVGLPNNTVDIVPPSAFVTAIVLPSNVFRSIPPSELGT